MDIDLLQEILENRISQLEDELSEQRINNELVINSLVEKVALLETKISQLEYSASYIDIPIR